MYRQHFQTSRHKFPEKTLTAHFKCNTLFLMKTAAVHSRIEPETKKMAEGILRKLGLSPTEAIRLFYTQITLRNGLPFNISIPNEETVQALDDSRKNRNLTTCANTDQLFATWNE